MPLLDLPRAKLVVKHDALQRGSVARHALWGERVKLNVEKQSVEMSRLLLLGPTIFKFT